MPLRCLIGNSDNSVFPVIPCKIKPEQIIHIGARELDDAEVQFMDKNCICRITVDELDSNGFEKVPLNEDDKVYIHLDLDVLDPEEFPYVPLPVPKGIAAEKLKDVLEFIKKNSTVVGVGIRENKPVSEQNDKR